MKSAVAFFIPMLAAACANAHGYVADLIIADKHYKGNEPAGAKNPSVIRQVSDVSPVKGATNTNINCGLNATPASLVANANPGDKVSFSWKGGDGSNWPHNIGPMLTYMASCGDQTCDKFDSTTAEWFKIQEVGQISDGNWAQADLMKGASADIILPSNIAPGNYLIRHEIIALHLANEKGGAEFYPSCSQLIINGSGQGKPKDSELVSLPGAYHDDDPGIYVPGIFDGNLDYQFPGPSIATFVSDASDSSGNSGSGSSTYGSSPTAITGGSEPTASYGPSPSSSMCKLKKSKSSGPDANNKRSIVTGLSLHPRHISRVMRNIVFGNGQNSLF